MVTVYRLKADLDNRIPWAGPPTEDYTFFEQLKLYGLPDPRVNLPATWRKEYKPLRVVLFNEALKRGRDKWKFADAYQMSSSIIAFSSKAKKVLEPLLEPHGVFLPLELLDHKSDEIGPLWIFRVETLVEALDPDRCTYDPRYADEKGCLEIVRYEFKGEVVANLPIFKDKYDFSWCVQTFVTDPFAELVAKYKLTGLDLKRVWSSDDPLPPYEPPEPPPPRPPRPEPEVREFRANVHLLKQIEQAYAKWIDRCGSPSPSEVAKAVFGEVDQLLIQRDEFIDSRDELPTDVWERVDELGMAWARALATELGWEIIQLQHGVVADFAVVSPKRGFAVFPQENIARILHEEDENNTLLLFDMIRTARFGEDIPDKYQLLQ